MDDREQEKELKEYVNKTFGKEMIDLATKAVINYEVNASYMNTVWKKGQILLLELDRLGYKIAPK